VGVAVKGDQQSAINTDEKFNKGRIPLLFRDPRYFHWLFTATRENYFLAQTAIFGRVLQIVSQGHTEKTAINNKKLTVWSHALTLVPAEESHL
jgi:hypothetical protein